MNTPIKIIMLEITALTSLSIRVNPVIIKTNELKA
jgi:hypothetical protein